MTGQVAARSRYPVVPYQYYARTGSGHTPARSVDEYWQDCDIPWVTTADVKHLRDGRRQVIEDTQFHISEVGLANSAAKLHPAGTVVLSRTASVGFSAIMGRAMATSQDFVTWTPTPDLEPRYLLWVLRAMKGVGDLDRLMYGSTHKTIYVPDLQQLIGPLPPVEQQRQIADYLDTETARIDALVDKVAVVQALLAERRTATVAQLLAEPAPRRPLRYCLSQFIGGDWGSEAGEAEHDVRVYRAADFDRVRHVVRHKRAPIRSVTSSSLRTRELRDGDVIIEKSGGGEQQPVGCAVAYRNPLDGSTAIPSNFNARLVPSPDVDSEYLNLVLAALYRTGETRPFINQTTGIQNLELNSYLDVEVPLPSPARQRQVASELLAVWDRLDQLANSIDVQTRLLHERRQALITATVTGELEV